MTSEPSRRISSLRRPTALSSLSPRNELLQTSSASRSVLWTAVGRSGRISYSVTGTPYDAACHAASEPARPPPIIVTIALGLLVRSAVAHIIHSVAGPHPRDLSRLAHRSPRLLQGLSAECTEFNCAGAPPPAPVAARLIARGDLCKDCLLQCTEFRRGF